MLMLTSHFLLFTDQNRQYQQQPQQQNRNQNYNRNDNRSYNNNDGRNYQNNDNRNYSRQSGGQEGARKGFGASRMTQDPVPSQKQAREDGRAPQGGR